MTNSTLISDVDPTSNPNRHVLPLPRIIAGGVVAAALLTGLSTEVGAEPVSGSVGHTSVMPEGWAPDYGSLSLDFPGVVDTNTRPAGNVSRTTITSDQDKSIAYGVTSVSYRNRVSGRPYIQPDQVAISCRRKYDPYIGSWIATLSVKFSGLIPNSSKLENYTNGNAIYYSGVNYRYDDPDIQTLIANRRGNVRTKTYYSTPIFNPKNEYEQDVKVWTGEVQAMLVPPYGFDLPSRKLATTTLGLKVPCLN